MLCIRAFIDNPWYSLQRAGSSLSCQNQYPMQRGISQRGSSGVPQSPEAGPGSISPAGEPPNEQGGPQSVTNGWRVINQSDSNSLENEIFALKKQLAEQERKIRSERLDLEKRESLVRYAAGWFQSFLVIFPPCPVHFPGDSSRLKPISHNCRHVRL